LAYQLQGYQILIFIFLQIRKNKRKLLTAFLLLSGEGQNFNAVVGKWVSQSRFSICGFEEGCLNMSWIAGRWCGKSDRRECFANALKLKSGDRNSCSKTTSKKLTFVLEVLSKYPPKKV
jgi:hypothetical protein